MDLVGKLTTAGALTPEWQSAFLTVPRSRFLPGVLWDQRSDGKYHAVHFKRDPERWRELADSDEAVVTQVDDGCPVGPGLVGEAPTSSSSMPVMVALMLKHLEVHGGEHVLEIGTGTGWNAALLARRLGADRITTLEIDPAVARAAQQALVDTGFAGVRALVGDGINGCVENAPYYRVISTAACHTVPYAWVEQCRSGGRIVTPWGTEWSNWALVALDVHDDKTASGAVVHTSSFMRLRGQRIPFCQVAANPGEVAQAETRSTFVRPSQVMCSTATLMVMTAKVPDCQARYRPAKDDPDGEEMLFLADRLTGSWARVHGAADVEDGCRVYQYGERRLFDEVEAAYQWWVSQDRPRADEWRVIVDRSGQRIELM